MTDDAQIAAWAVPTSLAGTAHALFGALLPTAERYARLLATDGVTRGLIGPREVPRLWERHLLNCAAVGELLPHGARLVDVGSGAGLPGLVLAISRPDLTITLLEPLLRRVTFLEEAVGYLGLSNVGVERGRAEELGARLQVPYATARAVAPLDRLVPLCLPLLEKGGRLLAMKGVSAESEVEQARPALRKASAGTPRIVECGRGVVDPPVVVVEVPRA